MLGAAWIADRAVIPALAASRNGAVQAIASRAPERASDFARRHRIPRVHASYDGLLADPGVDAVYVALPNSLHLQWTLRALAAGKHVLCEKPLALSAAEGELMAEAAGRAGRLLMEAVMYRFHPETRRLVASCEEVLHVQAGFGFPLTAAGNYRNRPELGGGALLDVGCYLTDVARWILGEPDRVEAVAHHRQGLDLSWSIALGFPGGALASLFASFESCEHQELVVVEPSRVVRRERPFTAWRDPHDPYQLMVEAFAESILGIAEVPLPLGGSLANLRLLDRIRAAAGPPGQA